MEHTQYDDVCKVAVVGPEGAGKSCLVHRFIDSTYDAQLPPTIGVDFRIHNIPVDGLHAKVHLWDTTGCARFSKITHAYYRVAHGILLAYDSSDPCALERVELWL